MQFYHMCAWYLWKPEEGIGLSGPGIKDGFEPSCECWELNLDPVQEQQVLNC